jgi:hypothetical protein
MTSLTSSSLWLPDFTKVFALVFRLPAPESEGKHNSGEGIPVNESYCFFLISGA